MPVSATGKILKKELRKLLLQRMTGPLHHLGVPHMHRIVRHHIRIFVPFNFATSRIAHNKGICGSTSSL